MKRIKLLFFSVFVLLFGATDIKAQGSTCPGTPFCTAVGTPFDFPNTHNGSVGTGAGSWGCLCLQPDPSWFYVKTTAAGNMTFNLTQGTTAGGNNLDVDFIAYGPFTATSFTNGTACNSLTGSCGACSTTPNPACNGNITDCSYSAASTESMTLHATAAGQYFIIMITNFATTAGFITFTQTGGPGTDCSITCNPTTITMLGQDAATNANIPSGSTIQCASPFWVDPKQPSPFVDASSDMLTPCLMVDFNTFNTNENTNGSLTLYEAGSPWYSLCNSCSQGTIGGGVGTTGVELYEYLSFLDSTIAHPVTFCNTSTVGTTTVSIKNCWDGSVYAGPVVWNTTAASCFTLTVPATAHIGSAVYSITPVGGGVGVYDYHDGFAYVDPNLMPAGTYTLTYTFHGRDGCAPGIGKYVFTVPTKPVVTVTPSATTICAGSSTSLTGGGANTYTWNTGSSSNPLSVSPGSTTIYTLTGTNTGTGCKNTATATVTVNPLPVLTITPSPAALCSGSSSILTASGGTTYAWSANAGSATTTTVSVTPPVGTTVYTVTGTTSGCSSVKTVTLTVTATPTLSITGTTSICSGNSTTLTGSGASTYTWSVGSNSAAISVNPSTTSSYTLTGTSATGGCVSSPTVITVNVTPTPTLAPTAAPASICSGSSTVLSANPTTGAATTFNWNPGGAATSTVSVSPTSTTVYTVTSTNGGICPTTKTLTVTVVATPTLIVSGGSICSGNSITLTNSGTVLGTYTWSPTGGNAGAATVSPTSTTVYTLSGATGACTGTTTATVNVTPSPTLAPTAAPASICSGSSTTLNANASGATSYNWNPGGAATSTVSVSPTSTTVYTVTSTNGGICPTSKTLTVTVVATPTLIVSGGSICSGNSITLTNSGTVLGSYTWSPTGGNAGAATVSPTSTTVYTLSGATGACTGTTTATVNVTPSPTLAPAAAPASICSGSSTILSANPTTGAATTFNWNPGGAATSTVSVSPTSTTVYTVTSTNGGICPTSKTLTVTVVATPTLIVSGGSICSGNSITLTNSGTVLGTYTWSPTGGNAGSATVSPTSTTVYTLSGANGACSGTTTATVNVTPTPTLIINGGAICSGQNIVLNNTGSATSYTWLPTGGSTSSATVSPSSSTTYTLTGANGTCTATALATVAVTTTPTVSINGAVAICNGQNLVLTGTGATSYSWSSGGITSNTITVNPTTTSAYTLTGANGTCTGTTVATITVNQLPIINSASITPAPCGQNTGCINSVSVSGGAPTYSYSWNGGTSWSSSSTLCNDSAGTYVVIVKDQNGCNATSPFTVPSLNGPVAPTAQPVSPNYCLGDTATFNVNPTTIGITYNWTNISGGGTYTGATYTVANINPSGTYTVSVAAADNNGCLSSATTLTVTVNQIPPTSVSGTTHFCKGTSTILNASPSGAGFNYQWSQGGTPISGATNATYTANAAGNYGVVITNSTTGCKAASGGNYTILIDSLPKIDTTSMVVTNSSCTSSTGSVLSVTVNPSAGNAYSWTNSGGTVVGTSLTLNNVPAGNYCLLVTTNLPTSCRDSVCGVTISNAGAPPMPTLTTPTNTYCAGQAQSQIIVSGTGSFSWYSDAGLTTQIATGTTYTPNVVTTTTLYVTATNSGCQSTSLPIVITINPNPAVPVLTVPSSNTYCQSQTVGTLSATATGGGTILWSASSTMSPLVNTGNTYTPGVLPIGTTVYYLTDSLNTGCKSVGTTTVSVTINQTPNDPTVSAQSATYCQGQPIAPITANGTGTILWYDNAGLTPVIYTGATFTPPATIGTITYYVVDSLTNGGCKSTGTVTVIVTVNSTPPNPIVAPSNTFVACQGQSIGPINVTGTGTIIWSTSPTMNPIVYTGNTYSPTGLPVSPPSTVYYIQDTSIAGCRSASASTSVTVTINQNPTITGVPTIDSSKCGSNNGDVLGLNATGGTPNYTFQWIDQTGATVGNAADLTPIGPGTYSLIVTDANQCKDTSNTSFSVFGTSTIHAGFTPSVTQGQAPLNVVFANTSIGAANYGWTFGNNTLTSTLPNPVYTYTTNGTYTVTLLATNGSCRDSTYAVITVDIPTSIVIPNIFSPNGDGLNDEFIITCTGMKTLNCDIFNRWGQLVYTLTAPNQNWDGKLNNGNQATEGTYYFMLNAVGVDAKTYTYQGPITLVK